MKGRETKMDFSTLSMLPKKSLGNERMEDGEKRPDYISTPPIQHQPTSKTLTDAT